MSLSDLASLGSFVSGFAVLVSLIYLALQVRQTQKNQRALMMQGQTDRATSIGLQLAQPHLMPMWTKATSGEEFELSPLEVNQLMQVARAFFRTYEEGYAQHRNGLLDEAAYETVTRHVRALLQVPAVRAAWKLLRPSFESTFRVTVDELSESARKLESARRLEGRPSGYVPAFPSALKDETRGLA